MLQVVTDRTVKACATVLTARAATTSMEPVCASRASAVRTAGTGCAQTAYMACTVSACVSARTNTHSGKSSFYVSLAKASFSALNSDACSVNGNMKLSCFSCNLNSHI